MLGDGWQLGVGKRRAPSVLWADGGWGAIESFEGPYDVKSGVIPENGAFTGGMIEVGCFVEDFGGVGEDQEAMGEAFWDPEHLEGAFGGLGFEVEASPLAEVGGVAAKIDGDIPDVAGEDADEFALGLAELVVETSEHAFCGEGLVVLNEMRGEAGGGKC